MQPQKLLSTDWEGADIVAHHSAVLRYIAICVCVCEFEGGSQLFWDSGSIIAVKNFFFLNAYFKVLAIISRYGF